jgi:aminoglycoside phosphotransferase (APT) family kinase protein
LTVEQFTQGQSNPTYLLRTPAREYVLRRKPPGQLLASAHAVDREYRVMTALGAHTSLPVPRTFALCTDDSVIGSWFFVMERMQGRIFWDVTFPELPSTQRDSYFDAMNATIAALHSVNFAAIGLADYGKPGDYARRQIKRWSGQYLQDTEAGRVSAMDALIDWLSANVSNSDEASIVHGDFRCDNLIFHPSEPRIVAVLDWELSTLGHPLADFAYHLMMYYLPDMAIPGSRGRLARGTAVSARAREYAAGVERLAQLGLDLTR